MAGIMKRTFLLGVVCGLSACNGAPTSVTGEVEGATLAAGDTWAFQAGVPGTNPPALLTEIGLSDQPTFCRGDAPAGGSELKLVVASNSSQQATLPNGTYPVLPPQSNPTCTVCATAAFEKRDAACGHVVDDVATGGTITISSNTSTAISGSFDLTFPDGGHLRGPFSSSLCDGFAQLDAGIPPPCR